MAKQATLDRDVVGASENDGPQIEALALSQADLIFATKHTKPVVKVMKPRIASNLAYTPPVNSTPPTITGTGTVGQTLVISNIGTWVGGSGPSYKWQRDGADIAGQTSNSHVVVAADQTHTVRAVVSQTNQFGTTAANSNGIACT